MHPPEGRSTMTAFAFVSASGPLSIERFRGLFSFQACSNTASYSWWSSSNSLSVRILPKRRKPYSPNVSIWRCARRMGNGASVVFVSIFLNHLKRLSRVSATQRLALPGSCHILWRLCNRIGRNLNHGRSALTPIGIVPGIGHEDFFDGANINL
jgi:hypothetical protein